MKTPGLTVKPLINMAGTKGFNELFFENVRVPRDALLGEQNRGWYMATTTLSYERTPLKLQHGLSVSSTTWCATPGSPRKWQTSERRPVVRQRLAQLAIEVDVAWCLSYRVATTQSRNQIPGPESPANKVFTSEMIQRLAQTGMQMLGLYGQLEFSTKWAPLKGKSSAYT